MNAKSQPVISEETIKIQEALDRAVRKELERKAKLGLNVIVARDGRVIEIPAAEALKDA